MCGIYGTTNIFSESLVSKKLEAIKFRGPDAQVFKNFDNKVVLGHNRLSILDLDSRSNQPFEYEYVKVVFNGEIFNYQEIKNKLLNLGYNFRTTSDTEVLCAAYIAYGEEFVNVLNGMFSFVIYNTKENVLFGARDRLGQKPFYYSMENGNFEFSSQIQQIALGNNFEIDEVAIAQYLNWNYIPEPLSIYKGISKLEAGHSFTYQLGNKKFSKFKYWDLPSQELNYGYSYNETKEELKELLSDAVKLRMLADVPVGVFLSGGIDSSLIASLAQSTSNRNVRSFSIKFEEDSFDESVYARKVASAIGTNHTEITCSYGEGLSMIEGITKYYDEPFADSSMIPTLLLAKHTKEHVTVALSGDGGDESFLGYTRYDWMQKVSPVFKIPRILRRGVGGIISLSPNYKHKLIGKGISLETIEKLYISMMSSLNDTWQKNSSIGREVGYTNYLSNNKNLLESMSDFDLKTYINGDINTKVDRATMAFSLEARSPLMDYRVVELARRIPTEFKYYKGIKKRILKDILYDRLDPSLFDRPKAGFGVPIESWFRSELKDLVKENLSSKNLKGIPGIHEAKVSRMISDHFSNKSNNSDLIWKLLVLKQWINRYQT